MTSEVTKQAETAAAINQEGLTEVAQGIKDLADAQKTATVGTAAAMMAASDYTRAVDAQIVADRLTTLSQVISAAGVNDVSQGTEMLAASSDVEAMSAVVGLMSLADLERGLALGRLAGELQTISDVVSTLKMPVLSAVLDDRGHKLQDLAVEVILHAAASRSLAQMMAATGQRLDQLGTAEVDEGLLRLKASELAAKRAEELADASLSLGVKSAVELAVASAATEAAREMTATGVAEIATGSVEVGAGAALEEAAS